MGFEPITVRTPVRCSYHWATGNSSSEQWSLWTYNVTQALHRASHIVSMNVIIIGENAGQVSFSQVYKLV